jgi:hypothetical protein
MPLVWNKIGRHLAAPIFINEWIFGEHGRQILIPVAPIVMGHQLGEEIRSRYTSRCYEIAVDVAETLPWRDRAQMG